MAEPNRVKSIYGYHVHDQLASCFVSAICRSCEYSQDPEAGWQSDVLPVIGRFRSKFNMEQSENPPKEK